MIRTMTWSTLAMMLPAIAHAAEPLNAKAVERVSREVRHELVMLPFYDVFDNLAFQVSPDGRVTLLGSVTRPTLKSSAENVVSG